MIRRLLDSVYVLLFVWTCMLLGLWVIHSFVVPQEFPGTIGEILSGIFKVAISFLLVLLWLWIWREIVKRSFWRAIKGQHFINESSNEISKNLVKKNTPSGKLSDEI
ncbi:MAG: hypothetical protein QXX08_11175 [Candidatus Bathyarchaeia archaeon]